MNFTQGLHRAVPSTRIEQVVHAGDGPTPGGMLAFEELISSSEPIEAEHRGGGDLAAVFYTGGTTLNANFGAEASAVSAGSKIAENSSRWVRLTKESAERVKKYGLMQSETPGVHHAIAGARRRRRLGSTTASTPSSSPVGKAGYSPSLSQCRLAEPGHGPRCTNG
ncbi:hypothetical protein [Geodermatophilus sp. SYSU D00815]